MVGQTAVSLVTGMVSGVAFGALLLASAPAIVLYFVLPIALGALGSLPALEDAARWLDGGRYADAADRGVVELGTQWARAATTLALWMLLPLLVGLVADPARRGELTRPARQCGSSPVAAGGRDSSASEVIASRPRAAASSTSVASSSERA